MAKRDILKIISDCYLIICRLARLSEITVIQDGKSYHFKLEK
jgi:hypothetical protein